MCRLRIDMENAECMHEIPDENAKDVPSELQQMQESLHHPSASEISNPQTQANSSSGESFTSSPQLAPEIVLNLDGSYTSSHMFLDDSTCTPLQYLPKTTWTAASSYPAWPGYSSIEDSTSFSGPLLNDCGSFLSDLSSSNPLCAGIVNTLQCAQWHDSLSLIEMQQRHIPLHYSGNMQFVEDIASQHAIHQQYSSPSYFNPYSLQHERIQEDFLAGDGTADSAMFQGQYYEGDNAFVSQNGRQQNWHDFLEQEAQGANYFTAGPNGRTPLIPVSPCYPFLDLAENHSSHEGHSMQKSLPHAGHPILQDQLGNQSIKLVDLNHIVLNNVQSASPEHVVTSFPTSTSADFHTRQGTASPEVISIREVALRNHNSSSPATSPTATTASQIPGNKPAGSCHKRPCPDGEDDECTVKRSRSWNSMCASPCNDNAKCQQLGSTKTSPGTPSQQEKSSPNKTKGRQGSANDPQSIAARHRRERISERLKILQELVPNGSKVDLVTMLEKAINYVKFLQLQVKVLATDEYWPTPLNTFPKIASLTNLLAAKESTVELNVKDPSTRGLNKPDGINTETD